MPAAVPGLELEAPARRVGDEAVGTGAHGLDDERRRVQRHDGDERQLVEQDGVRPAGLHLDRMPIDGAHRRHLDQVARHLALRVRARPLEAHHHVGRPHRPAVLEPDARPQLEPPGEVVGVVPTGRQRRTHVHVGIEGHQRVIDVVQHPMRRDLVVQVRIEPLRVAVEHQAERFGIAVRPTGAGRARPPRRQRSGERQPCRPAPGVPPQRKHPAAPCSSEAECIPDRVRAGTGNRADLASLAISPAGRPRRPGSRAGV